MALLETLVVVLGVALISALAVVAKTKLFPVGEDEEPREDVAEYIAMMVSVLYAVVLPEDRREPVREAARSYANHVVEVEWPRMVAREPLGGDGWSMLDRLRAAGEAHSKDAMSHQIAAHEVLAQLGYVDDARRGREAAAQERLSPVQWTGLLIGGALTLAFMFLFGIRRNVTHVVMVMGLSGFIAFTVLLIHQLDAPFGALLGATSDPFTRYFPPA